MSGTRIERILHEIVGVVALAGVHVATAISFARVFAGWSYLPDLLIMIVVAHVLAGVLRVARVPFFVALPLLCLGVFVVLGHLALASTLRYGLPLSDTWETFGSRIADAWNLLGDVVPPVDSESGFGLAALAALGLSAILADSFAFRFGGRSEAFVPATVVFVVVAAVGIDRLQVTSAAVWIGAVLAAVALLRTRDRTLEIRNRTNSFGYRPAVTFLRLALGGLLLAIAVGAGASVAGPRLPGANEEAWLESRRQGDSRVLQPLVDVRRRLNNPTDQVLFTVTAERSAYWRMTSLPIFDGSTWTVPESLLEKAGGDLAAINPSPEQGLELLPNLQRVSIESLAGTFVPIAFEPVQLRATSRSLYYDTKTASLVVGGDGIQINDSYELVSNMPTPRSELLATATAASPPKLDGLDTSYLAVPDTDEIEELRNVVAGIVDVGASPYALALSLQSYFRDNFTYSLDVPSELDGGATLAFLERRTGYCEQFSSTFALFARLLGIPSRVAVGFTPGQIVGEVAGRTVFEVRAQHAHAWPEVWFDGIGWVLFEPTPGRGAPNSGYTNVPEQQDESVPVPSTQDPVPATTTTTIAPVPIDGPPTTTPIVEPPVPPTESGSRSWWTWPVAGIFLLALWMVAMPRTIRSVAHRRRTGTVLDPWRRALALYELQRGPFVPALSPQEIASRATSRLWDDDPFIGQLADVVTEFLFGGRVLLADELERWNLAAEEYLSSRIAALPWSSKVRLRLDPWAVYRLSGAERSR
ncbi:MAG: transglutaminaseTgpA domain-containing protein [Actinomycetota bacterium]